VFGRVEGLYTRTELMKSLVEQKTHSRALEHQAKEFTNALEESGRLVEVRARPLLRLCNRRLAAQAANAEVSKLQGRLEAREEEIMNLKMTVHNAEQELVQMRAGLSSTVVLVPRS
jgi:adenine-specific DNA glycosylase